MLSFQSTFSQENFLVTRSEDFQRLVNDESSTKWKESYRFIHATDTQFGLIEKFIDKKKNPMWEAETRLVNAMIDKINLMDPLPKFVVITGDMVDCAPENDESYTIHKKQYQSFIDCFKNLSPKVGLVCCCGNHDVGDHTTKEGIDLYREEFGKDFFSFWVGGVKYTILNSQYFTTSSGLEQYFKEQWNFMDTIKDERAIHSVIFQHIPPIVEEKDKTEGKFMRLDEHWSTVLLEKLKRQGADYLFCGHMHRNREGTWNGIKVVVSGPVGGTFDETKSGFTIVDVQPDFLHHQYVEL